MTRIVELREGVLKKNDLLARELRARFQDQGVLAMNFVSGPGTGKTTLLEATLRKLVDSGRRVAAITGDVATDNDARRLASSGAPVEQIETHGVCHLDAEMISRSLESWDLGSLEILFIENVGNLVCPSSYDLGESIRVALLGVGEGEDKPVKYPTLFNTADVAVITKIDLSEPCEFDREAAMANLDAVRPGIRILEISAKKDVGMSEWFDFIEEQRSRA